MYLHVPDCISVYHVYAGASRGQFFIQTTKLITIVQLL